MDTTPRTETTSGQGGVPGTGVPGGRLRDVVQLTLPAASAYLSVLRTATASLAARADFTLDDIEDLRIAVDEACALLLLSAVPGSGLECTFELSPGVIDVSVTVLSLDGEPPSVETFAWTVLTALADEVSSSVDADSRVTIVLRKRRGIPEEHIHSPRAAAPETPAPAAAAPMAPWTENAGAPATGPVGTP
ncbi:anti-sigma factor [Protofrankia sp. BMG5.30]|uniref:Anti-sigma factor n=1 Tax=Protofrankia coriariae TaxID=1562887 RepID=A0ABR5F4V7_9ACTN|nr:anti-sigma factor [Protofrankia coriariae]ONH38435.1 anti-sigma factor [Protofrankia sp. BMG5.30]